MLVEIINVIDCRLDRLFLLQDIKGRFIKIFEEMLIHVVHYELVSIKQFFFEGYNNCVHQSVLGANKQDPTLRSAHMCTMQQLERLCLLSISDAFDCISVVQYWTIEVGVF